MRLVSKHPLVSVLLVSLLALPLACKRSGEEGSGSSSGGGGDATSSTAGTDGAASKDDPAAPLSAATLVPVIREMGSEGAMPDRIVIEFSRNVVDGSMTNRETKKTVLKISPAVPGTLVYSGPSTLTFTASKPLGFETRYQVALEEIETKDGVLKGTGGPAWKHEFTTPSFSFLRMTTQKFDLGRNRLVANLVFSGPVSASSVRNHLEFTLDGRALSNVRLEKTSEPNVLAATVNGGGVKQGARLLLQVKNGLPADVGGSVKASAATASIEIAAGKPIHIKAAVLKEGTNGFYVDVVCDDTAAAGGKRYYWDHESYDSYYVSRRCQLTDADLSEYVRFNPAVKFYSSPGQGGFRIFGEFGRGPYSLTIGAGATTIDGGTLHSAFEKSFSVPARKPKVSFVSSGRYLPRSAWKNLAINHLNVEKVELTVRHIPPENLVFWLSDEHNERADERTSNQVLKTTLPVTGKPDTMTTTWIDVGSMLPAATKGVLELNVRGNGASAASRLLLTDMSLVAKKSLPPPGEPWNQEVFVWAMNMDSTDLLSGVDVTLVRKSGKTMARCTTSGGDGCILKVGASDEDKSEPFAIVARRGDDLTYIRYSDLRTDTADFAVTGEPFVSDRVYRAAVWSDRGVYRPGDTAHLAAIVRDRGDVAPQAGLPVEVKLIDPREKVAKKLVVKTNEAGMVSIDFPFAAFADTGRYEAKLSVADKPVGAYTFSVEEFVPERMKVEAKTIADGYSVDDTVPVEIAANYLFGGSAEGSPVELTCQLEPSTFRPKENATFQYGVWRQSAKEARTLTLGQVRGAIDEKGNARLECPALAVAGGFQGAGRVVANVSVFEGGSGRSTVGQAVVPVHPERYYLGLTSGTKKVSANKPFQVSGIVVDWNGNVVGDALKEVEVEFLRLESEYGYFWDDTEERETYQRWLRPISEGTRKVAVQGGKFSIDATPNVAGSGYVVRVKAGAAQTDLSLESDYSGWYWWDEGESRVDQTPKPQKPASVALTMPKAIEVGESATVTFTAPYKGRVLMTAETDRVISAEWKAVDAGENTWKFKLKTFSPNVYVSAFLVKDPHIESKEAFLPDRAFGVQGARVTPVEFTQNVKMTVPEEVRSNSKLTVTLDLGKVKGPTFATVAAVDEGILSLTKFKSPDPFDAIFAKRALGVETYETVGWTMLLPPANNNRSTGGDGEGELEAGRVQPVKPVAMWSGIVPVDGNGKATVTFDVPQYRGSLRVMAVTAGQKRMGRASANVRVADPIVLSTTLPRFVTEGDELQIPVFVTNMSGGPLDIQVKLTAENLPVPGLETWGGAVEPIKFLGKPEGRIKLENGKAGTLVFQAKALMSVGAAKFRVSAKGGNHESFEDLDVPFLPSGPKERIVQRLELAEGTIDLKPHLDGWVPTSEKSTFWVTGNPYGDTFDHLKFLVRYPYGCIEQTTSTTRPLLFVGNLVEQVDPTLVAQGKTEDMVMAGINRLLSMQTPSGGLSYWPGATQPIGWGTAYATHTMLDAQKLGYPVPQDRLNDIFAWMEQEVQKYENGNTDRDWYYGRSSEAYMQYVLALAGKGRKARIQKLIDEPYKKDTGRWYEGKRDEELYMLKAALHLAGDRRYEKDLKNPDVSPIRDDRRNDWSFYSDRRRRGFMLSTYQDLFGNEASGEVLANLVAEGLRGHKSGWYNTQELVWGVTGLGKRVSDAAKNYKPGALIANGKRIEGKAGKGKSSDRSWALHRASEYTSLDLEIKDAGKGGKLWLIMSSEGVRQNATFKTGGNGLKLARTYRTLEGDTINPASGMNLADLVFVEIAITNTTGERIQNVAMVDRLPAGWEIENPRLGRGASVEWLDPNESWSAEYMNVRDDRIEVFGAIERGQTRKIVYAVRAVTSGKFTIPPIEAEAMYDPNVWAREAGGEALIEGPWADFLL